MDTLKKRMQVCANFTEQGKNASQYGIISMIKCIYTKEGFFKGFYKGVTVNFFKVSDQNKCEN